MWFPPKFIIGYAVIGCSLGRIKMHRAHFWRPFSFRDNILKSLQILNNWNVGRHHKLKVFKGVVKVLSDINISIPNFGNYSNCYSPD